MQVRIEQFTDATGTTREGYIEKISDRGGTDISYHMRSLDGAYYIVSGSRIRTMRFVRMAEINR